MKNKLMFSLAFAACLPFMTGCKSMTISQLNTTKAVMAAVVPVGVEFAVMKDTNTIPYFRASADVIDTVASGTNVSPAQLSADLQTLPGNLFKSPYAVLAVNAGIGIYTAFFAQTAIGDPNTVIILQALAADIRLGLPPVTSVKSFKSKIKRSPKDVH